MNPYVIAGLASILIYGGYRTEKGAVWIAKHVRHAAVVAVQHQGKPKPAAASKP